MARKRTGKGGSDLAMAKSEQEKLKEAAYHEAGHAVAAFAMSRQFGKVSIVPEGELLGSLTKCGWRSKLNPELDDAERLRLRRMVEAEIILSLAGCVAEAKITGEYNHIGASGDYNDVVFYASYITDSTDETGAYIAWLLEKTKNVLSRRWDAVELLADELIKRREIGYKTAREIIRKGLDGGLPPLNLKRALAKEDRRAK